MRVACQAASPRARAAASESSLLHHQPVQASVPDFSFLFIKVHMALVSSSNSFGQKCVCRERELGAGVSVCLLWVSVHPSQVLHMGLRSDGGHIPSSPRGSEWGQHCSAQAKGPLSPQRRSTEAWRSQKVPESRTLSPEGGHPSSHTICSHCAFLASRPLKWVACPTLVGVLGFERSHSDFALRAPVPVRHLCPCPLGHAVTLRARSGVTALPPM